MYITAYALAADTTTGIREHRISGFAAYIPAQLLVERRCIKKHESHVCHGGYIPRIKVLVESNCTSKHIIHVCHSGNIPRRNARVESRCISKH
jgi:hypothetical protein